MKRLRIKIGGVVQGVGFRPFVYSLARGMGLTGFVRNSSAGVEIEVEGGGVDAFLGDLRHKTPPLAEIVSFEAREIPLRHEESFTILASEDGGASTHVSPDASICADCLRELTDPDDRRFLYPFINCTNCGPRYSITMKVPYDRPHTTMSGFEMCRECRREFEDPRDRRFHAQPNACPECGPTVELVSGRKNLVGRDAVEAAIGILQGGDVVAVKGIGGYHLAADAGNHDAVARLRRRKRRNNKAFALMAPDMERVRLFAAVSEEEEALLCSRERPIVLLERTPSSGLPEEVAPGVPELGFMLPYSPLHALLFHQKPAGKEKEEGPNFSSLVMTSGNISEEPVVKANGEAGEKLSPLADAFLHHNREIFMRIDDSVVRRFRGQTIFVRRARGYVPSAIPLGDEGPQVLACGADLKNTFCLTTTDAAVVSQHIGDMENYESSVFFEETLENLKKVYRVAPVAIAHDLHPRYFSTRWAEKQREVEKRGFQHHWAHVASVIAEKSLGGKVIGIALDGSGYGGDGSIWGGEFLVADRYSFERRAHFRAVPMPGGEAAARNPWQMALSYLESALGEDEARKAASVAGIAERHGEEGVENVLKITRDHTLSPLTSGAGRLFESIAALLGIRDVNTFEGEAAMALEAAAQPGIEERYPFDIGDSVLPVIDFSGTLREIIREIAESAEPPLIAARFHNTVAAAVVETVCRIHGESKIRDVALTGGVFQNRLLLGKVMTELGSRGLRPFTNARVPANDAGISLGQACLLRALLKA